MNTVSDNTATSTANRGSRTYTVSGLDNAKTYDLELHEQEDVHIDADGNVTFENNSPATTGGSFEVVNGANVGTAGTSDVRFIDNVAPVNGSITFTVDSTVADRVIPVVNEDADGDNTLDLETGATATTPKAPTENFGIGGEKEFIPAEATAGSLDAGDVTVVRVNKDANYLLVDTGVDGVADRTVYYDANDQFRLSATTGNAVLNADPTADAPGTGTISCNPVSMDTFENNLSTGDEIDASSIYAADDAASSTLCLEDLTPTAVTGVTATALDSDSIEVAWGAIDANASAVKVYRKSGACTTTLTDYTLVTTLARTATKYQDDGLNSSTQYCYVVTQVVDGDESAISNQSAATTTAVGATAAPQVIDSFLVTDSTFQGEMSEGDVWRLIFDKEMQPLTDTDDVIRVQDAQGEVRNVNCDTDAEALNADAEEAACAFNTGNQTVAGTTYGPRRVLTVTFDQGSALDAENTVTGANDALDYPLTISNQSGFADLGGRAWTPTDDPDNVVDSEGTKTTTQAADQTGPTFSAATASAAQTVTITYDEAICVGNDDANGVYACDDGTPLDLSQFSFNHATDGDCAAGVIDALAPTGASSEDDDDVTLVLTFAVKAAGGCDIDGATDTGTLTYTRNGTPDGDVVDQAGVPQPSGDSVAVSA